MIKQSEKRHLSQLPMICFDMFLSNDQYQTKYSNIDAPRIRFCTFNNHKRIMFVFLIKFILKKRNLNCYFSFFLPSLTVESITEHSIVSVTSFQNCYFFSTWTINIQVATIV